MYDAVLLKMGISISLTTEYSDGVGEIRIIPESNVKNEIKYYSENFDEELRMIGKPKIRIIEAKMRDNDISKYFKKQTNGRVALCENCESYSEVKEDDEIFYGEFGLPYIHCPECGGEAYIEDEEGIHVDENNLEFPQHFYHFSSSKKAVKISDENLQRMARDVLRRLKGKGENNFTFEATGDSMVIALDFEDEAMVIVARDYYEFDYNKNEE
jgi:hypothetical protein